MEQQPKFKIILPQGKARRSFFEMTNQEQEEAAKRIFEKVTIEAAKVGQLPVVRRYPNSVTKNG